MKIHFLTKRVRSSCGTSPPKSTLNVPRQLQWTPKIKFKRVRSFLYTVNMAKVEKPNLCKVNFPLRNYVKIDNHSPAQIANIISFER